MFFLCLLPLPAWAEIGVPDYGGSITASWNGVGDVFEISGSQCVISTEVKGGNKPKPGKKKKYYMSAQVSGSPDFNLRSADGTLTVPFELFYFNRKGAAEPIINPGVLYGKYDGGDTKKCDSVSRFEVFIAENDLKGLPMGTYRASLLVTHVVDKTNETASGNIEIILSVTAAAIEMSGLGDVDLGSWDGVAPALVANESFCVSGTASGYRLRATGGASGFTLSNGIDTLLYEVRFAPAADARTGVVLVSDIAEGIFPLSAQCSGFNAALYIRTVTPLGDVSAGDYIGTLVVTAEPP